MTDAPTCPHCDGKGRGVSWSNAFRMCGSGTAWLGLWAAVFDIPLRPDAMMVVGGIVWLVGMAMRSGGR